MTDEVKKETLISQEDLIRIQKEGLTMLRAKGADGALGRIHIGFYAGVNIFYKEPKAATCARARARATAIGDAELIDWYTALWLFCLCAEYQNEETKKFERLFDDAQFSRLREADETSILYTMVTKVSQEITAKAMEMQKAFQKVVEDNQNKIPSKK